MIRLLCIALVACSFVYAAEPDIKGKLTIAGKDIALAHLMVLDFDDMEGMGDGPELRILISDKAVAQAELESPVLFNLDALAREGKLQGVLLRFDPKAETPEVHGTIYATSDNPQSSMPFFSLSGGGGGLETLKVEKGIMSGGVEISSEGDADFGSPSYSVAITFSGPVQKSTPVTVLKGKEAMNTPQMKTYLEFEEAMGSGDLDRIRKMATPEKSKQMDAFIAEAGKEQFLAMVKQMVSDPATREQSLQGLYVRGDHTTIVFDDQGGKMSVTLVKKGDAWILE
jgi:hypothetical protein